MENPEEKKEIYLLPSGTSEAIKRLREEIHDRSFSQRHPELGKMMNCRVCDTRHRASQVCHQRFVVELTPPEGLTGLTKNQIYGRAMFAKKRVLQHHSHRLLEIVRLTREIFPKYETRLEPEAAVKLARKRAVEKFFRLYRLDRKARNARQAESRRINRGA